MTYQLPEPSPCGYKFFYTEAQMQTAYQAGRDSMKADAVKEPMDLTQENLERVVAEINAAGKQILMYPEKKHPWVGLTDEEWEPLYDKFAKHQEYGAFVSGWGDFAKAIEAKLKEKNT